MHNVNSLGCIHTPMGSDRGVQCTCPPRILDQINSASSWAWFSVVLFVLRPCACDKQHSSLSAGHEQGLPQLSALLGVPYCQLDSWGQSSHLRHSSLSGGHLKQRCMSQLNQSSLDAHPPMLISSSAWLLLLQLMLARSIAASCTASL